MRKFYPLLPKLFILFACLLLVLPAEAQKKLSAGGYFSLAKCGPCDNAFSWGANWEYELGDSTLVDRYVPGVVHDISGVTDLAAGGYHSLALRSDGTVWAWGANWDGYIGDGTYTDRPEPVQSQITGVTAVAAGEYHSMALKSDGTVWCWGWNGDGELGDSTTTLRPLPVQVKGLTGVIAISAGSRFSMALKSDGTVWMWGQNSNGQLGDSTTIGKRYPVQVKNLTGITKISAGFDFAIALKSDGTLWSWGYNGNGQLGDGTYTQRIYRVQVSVLGTTVIDMDAGWEFGLAIKNDSTLWAWGYNGYGQLGNNSYSASNFPIQTLGGMTSVSAISAGGYHSLAAKSDGSIWGWGYNYEGQVGDGNFNSEYLLPERTLYLCPTKSRDLAIDLSAACEKYDTLAAGGTEQAFVVLHNYGCDTLTISNVTSGSANFTVNSFPTYIAPLDSQLLTVSFTPAVPGTYSTTITVFNNDADTGFCLQGVAIPPPVISVSPLFFNDTVSCNDTLVDTLVITNTGTSNLHWDLDVIASINDDFDPGINGSIWSVNNGLANTSCGSVSGNALFFDSNGIREAATIDLNTNLGGVVSFYLKIGNGTPGSCESLDGGEEVVLEYSTNGGGSWTNMTTFFSGTYGTFTQVNQAIPAGAQTLSTRFRWRQLSHSGGCCDHWAIDNVAINVTDFIAVSPGAGTTTPSTSTNVIVSMISTGLYPGQYIDTIFISSDDPTKPLIAVPCTLTVIGTADARFTLMDTVTLNCLDLDSIMAYTTSTDSIVFTNIGCDTLFIDSLKTSPSVFSVTGSFPSYILPDDTGYVKILFSPVAAGTFPGSLSVYTNEVDTAICLQGKAFAKPNACWNPDTFNITLGCNADSIVPLLICNTTGGMALTFNIEGDEGLCGDGTGGKIKVGVYNNATITTMLNTQSDLLATTLSTYNAATLANYDVLMNIRNGNLDQAAVLNWISNGGTWIGEWSSNPFPISTWGAITGTVGGSGSGSMSASVVDPSHYLAQNINWATMPVGQNPCDFMYDLNITDPLAATIVNVNHASFGVNPLLVEKKYGQGKIILFNWDYSDAPNYNAVVQDMIQEVVRYGGRGLSWLCPDTTAGTVAINDTNIINFVFNSTGLVVGTYSTTLTIATNDPLNNPVTIPVYLNVTGAAQFDFAGLGDTTAPSCLDMDSIMEYTSSQDSIYIANAGCDTLWLDSAKFSPSEFSLGAMDTYILPGDTGGVIVNFLPTSVNTFSGTLTLYTNDLDTVFCLKGKSFSRPDISFNPDTIVDTLACSATGLDTVTIYNTGIHDLIFTTSSGDSGRSALFDGTNDYMLTSLNIDQDVTSPGLTMEAWVYPTSNSAGRHHVISTDNGAFDWSILREAGTWYVFNGSTSAATGFTVDLNTWQHLAAVFIPGTGVKFYKNGVLATPTITVTTEASDDNIWVGSNSGGGEYFDGRIDEARVWNIQRSQANIQSTMNNRLQGNESGLRGYWQFDNGLATDNSGNGFNGTFFQTTVSVPNAPVTPSWLSYTNRVSDTIANGDSLQIGFQYTSTGLTVGQYTSYMLITSNDPINNPDTVVLIMNVVGAPNLKWAGYGDTTASVCLDLDSIMEYTTSLDSIYIANTGCDTLWLDSAKFSPSVFSLYAMDNYILPGDTGGVIVQFAPTSTVSITGSLNLYTNDADTVFCLKGKAFARPIISFDPDTFDVTLSCCDSTTLPLTISNTGGSDLHAEIIGGVVQIKVALVAADNAGYVTDVKNKLMATGDFTAVDIFQANTMTPTLAQLQAYDAVLTWGNNNYSNPTTLGNNLADYMDGGGGVVAAVFAVGGSTSILGRFSTDNYWCITSTGGNTTGAASMGTVYMPNHFLMDNVTSFNGGTNAWREFTSTIIPGATKIADWTDGRPLIVTRTINGHKRVDLGLFPPSNDIIGGGWLPATDGARIMANALLYTANADAPWLTITPAADTVVPGGSAIIDIQFNSCGLTVGTYTTTILVASNDPLNSSDTIPVTLTVQGTPNLQVQLGDTAVPMCLNLDSIIEFTSSIDTLFLTNTGCAPLVIDSIKISPSVFSITGGTSPIADGDSGWIAVQFAPLATGTFTGTLNLYTNELDTVICLKGKAYARPIVCHSPDTLFVTIPVCEDTVSDQLLVCNSGGSDLYWNIVTQSNLCDDFDPAITGSMWSVNTGAANTNCSPFSGNGLWFGTAGVRQAATVDMNTIAGGNISFYIALPQGSSPCEAADNSGESVYLEYSTNGGGVWTTIATYNYNSYPSLTQINLAIPAGAKTSSTRFRWTQNINSGSGFDNWILDNVCVTTSSANIIAVPASDTTAAGDTSVVNLFFTNNGLAYGTYTIPILISSNDPLKPLDTVIAILTLDSIAPVAPVASDTNICFGNPTPPLMATATPGDTVKWYNTSWTLLFTGATFNTGETAAGTYTYYVTSTDTINGCESQADTVLLYINTAPGEPTANNASSCFGQTVPALTSTGTINQWYTASPPTTPVFNGDPYNTGMTAAGTYTYYVTDSTGGCPESAADTVMLTIYALPNTPIANDKAACLGDPVPALTATVTGTDSLRWYNSAMAFVASGDTFVTGQTLAGTYTYYVTSIDTVTNCESVRDTVHLSINSTPQPTANNVSSCFGSTTPPLVATPNNSVQWYDDVMAPLAANDSLATGQTAVGTYTYYVTQTLNGCESTPTMVLLTINPIPTVPVAPDASSCFAAPTPSLTATGTNVKWYSNASLTTQVGSGSPFATGQTAAGTYTYYVTQTVAGCPSPSDTVYLTIYALPTRPLAANTVVCFGNPTPDLLATGIIGSDTVEWYTSSTLTPVIYTGNPYATGQTAVGTYTYYVTQTDTVTGCRSSSDTVFLSINSAPVEPAAGDVTVCFGQTVPSLSSTGSQNQWYNSSPPATPVYTGNPYNTGMSAVGSYTYYVTDSVPGCPESSPDTAVLTINPVPVAPVVSPQKDSICFGAANPAFSVSGSNIEWWSNAATTVLITSGSPYTPTVTTTGTYSYYVTQSALGCKSPSDTVIFKINSRPTQNLGADVTQCGGTVMLNAGNAGAAYLWSTTATTQTVSVSSTGTYSVVVTNSSGCSMSDTVDVTINTIPAAPLSTPQADSTCFGTANPSFAATGSTIQWWSNPATTLLVSTGSPFTPTVTVAGTYTYYVTQTTTGCKGPSDTVIFKINFTPAVSGNDTAVLFGGSTPDLIANGTGIQWYDTSLTIVHSGDTFTTGHTAVGTYTYYVTQTLKGCESAKDTVFLTIYPGSPVGTGASVCFAQPIPDLTSTGTNIRWYSDGALTTQVGTGSPFATGQTAAGTYTYYVTQSMNGVQSQSDTVLLTIKALPSKPVAANQVVCFGDSVADLSATGANIQWFDTSGTMIFAGNPFATGQTVVGTYTYYVTQTNTVTACSSPADTVFLTINPLPAAPLARTDTALCYGQPVPDLTATGVNITWYNSSSVQVGTGSPFATGVTAPGNHLFYATQTNTVTTCESAGDTVFLTINAAAMPVAPNVAVCVGATVPPLVAIGTDIKWYNTSGALVFSGDTFNTGQTAAGTYTYYVTQTNTVTTCPSQKDTVLLIISTQPTQAPVVPNANGCFGSVAPALTAAAGSNINWYSDAGLTTRVYVGNPFATGLTAIGSYTFYATDSTPGCPEGPSDTAVLVINSLPATPVVKDTAICFGDVTPKLIFTGTSVRWYDTSMAVVFSGDTFTTGKTAAATYTYYVSQTSTVTTCESVKDTVMLTIHALPAKPAALDTAVCSASAIPNLTTTGTNVQWYDTSWTVVNTGNTYVTGQTAAGTYTYYVTQTNTVTGCESVADTSILSIIQTPSVPVANNVSACQGSPIPALTATGVNPRWYSNASLTTLVNAGNSYATGQTAVGIYTYWVTDSTSGCPSSGADSVSLIINAPAAKPVANNVTGCYGTSASLTSTGVNPRWYSDATLINMLYAGTPYNPGVTAVGTYTFYVADYNAGCGNSVSDTVVLTINPAPLVTANTYSTSITLGDSVVLTAYNAISYTWAPPAGLNVTTGASVIAKPTTNTTYTVTGTNSYGCTGSVSIVVVVNPLGVNSFGDPIHDVSVYPNPAIGHFTLEFNTSLETPIDIYMVNTLGERVSVLREARYSMAGQNGSVTTRKYEIDTHTFTEGVYYLQIVTERGTVNRKVVLLR